MNWDIDELLDRDLTLKDLGLDKENTIVRFSRDWDQFNDEYGYTMEVKVIDNLEEYKLFLELKKKYEGQ